MALDVAAAEASDASAPRAPAELVAELREDLDRRKRRALAAPDPTDPEADAAREAELAVHEARERPAPDESEAAS